MVRNLLLVSTFLSAALLFVVQPLFAKYLLPFYGGTSSVWSVSLFFYSAVLVLGYLYAALLTFWPQRYALWLHGTLLVLLAGHLITRLITDRGIFVEPIITAAPALSVVLTLLAALGVPVLLLASTSVVTQHIWSHSVHGDPYRLYAVSNAGSLLGLALYPFVFEPFTELGIQGAFWVAGFVIFTILLLAVWRQSLRGGVSNVSPMGQLVPLQNIWPIVGLAAIPTFLLTSVTEYISKGIASFPMLWVLPLLLYLLSFVIGFTSRRVKIWQVPLIGWIALSFVPLLLVLPFMGHGALLYWSAVFYLLLTFFLVSVFIHRRLYERRPRIADLGMFYVWVTVGGAVGSGTVAFLMPLILDRTIELPIALGLVAWYFIWRTCRWLQGTISSGVTKVLQLYSQAVVVLLVAVLVVPASLITAERNFYGVIKVYDTDLVVDEAVVPVRTIVHGETNHGFQALDERYATVAASYYGQGSGIDLALRHFTTQGIRPRLSVIGLGAGMINAYCADVSTIEYIEINPLVEQVAREYFTYLAMCPEKTSVTIGDGRIELAKLAANKKNVFDVIMLDAFSDDAIPVHLLTSDAFKSVYAATLDSDGIVAFHVSNKYLQLQSPIVGAARSLGYDAVIVDKSAEPDNQLQLSSTWVLVGKTDVISELRAQFTLAPYTEQEYVWTDAKSSVLQALSLRGSGG